MQNRSKEHHNFCFNIVANNRVEIKGHLLLFIILKEIMTIFENLLAKLNTDI